MRDYSNTSNTSNGSQPREKARFWVNLPCGTGFPVPADSALHAALEAGVTPEQLLAKWAGTMYIRDTANAKPKFSYFD